MRYHRYQCIDEVSPVRLISAVCNTEIPGTGLWVVPVFLEDPNRFTLNKLRGSYEEKMCRSGNGYMLHVSQEDVWMCSDRWYAMIHSS
jgi:hypothetical protein